MSTQYPVPVTPKGKATYQRLIQAAGKVAVRYRGVVEISAVAEEAGVVPSLINRYFGSKAGLVCALIKDYYQRFELEVFDQFPEMGSWAVRERKRLEAGVRFHYRDPLSLVIYRYLAMEPEVVQTRARIEYEIVERGAKSIRKAQKGGELPVGVDPGLAAAAMFGAMGEVMGEALSRKNPPSQRQIVELLWRQVVGAVQLNTC